jgi:hypothetical protein
MCGCRGKWTDASAYATDRAGAGVSDRSVKIMYNKIMNHPDVKIDEDANCAYVNTDTRNMAVYFVEDNS